MNIDYHDTPVEPNIRKTGRVCKFCKDTGYVRGVPSRVWTEIHKTEEYQALNKKDKLEVQERFKEDIICTSCQAYIRLGLLDDSEKSE